MRILKHRPGRAAAGDFEQLHNGIILAAAHQVMRSALCLVKDLMFETSQTQRLLVSNDKYSYWNRSIINVTRLYGPSMSL